MEAFELRLWDGRLGRWLTVDPYGEFFSPYIGMGNNPISLTDPDGGSTEPPTDYVDEAGNLLLRTNDGSNAVITVCNDKLGDFWSSVSSSSWGLDTKAWNFQTKAWLVGHWSQWEENTQSWYTTADARRKVALFWQTGNYDYWLEAAIQHTNTYREDPLAWGIGIAGGIIGVEANMANRTRTTLHGSQRIAGATATRGGVLSVEGINTTKSLGIPYSQADGATVYLHQVTPGRFNAVVQGNKGIITTMENWSQKSINRIAKNYGWKL